MTTLIPAGVSLLIADHEVADMTDAEQDELIKRVAQHLEQELRNHVMDARPRSDLQFWVEGPHEHPILGPVHVHHLAMLVDVDDLHPDCSAMVAYRAQGNADPTLGVHRP